MEASLAAAVEEAARGALGTAFRVTSAEPASGGTHRNWIVGSAARRVFVKTGAATNLALFDAEVDALSAIAATGAIRTPAIVASGASEAHAFLILEHLPLRPMQAADAPRCAAALAQLHSTVGEHYGWRATTSSANRRKTIHHAPTGPHSLHTSALRRSSPKPRDAVTVATFRTTANASSTRSAPSFWSAAPNRHCCMATSGPATSR